jgi:hypothetical protein
MYKLTLIPCKLSFVQRFTNEDHLTVHKKKHDMVLNLGNGQKANVFVGEFIFLCVVKVVYIFVLRSVGFMIYIRDMESLYSKLILSLFWVT